MDNTSNKPKPYDHTKAFATPEDLDKVVNDYITDTIDKTVFAWVKFSHGIEKVERPVSVSIYHFCNFAKVHESTLREYRKKPNFGAPLEKLDSYIFAKAVELRENNIMPSEVFKSITARAKEFKEETETQNTGVKQIVVSFGAESVQIDSKPVDTSVSGDFFDFEEDNDKSIMEFKPNRIEKY